MFRYTVVYNEEGSLVSKQIEVSAKDMADACDRTAHTLGDINIQDVFSIVEVEGGL